MLARDRAPFGLDHPFSGIVRGDIQGATTAEDPDSLLSGAGCKGHGRVRRVDVAVIRRVECAEHAVEAVERVLAGNELRVDEFDVEAKRAADRERLAQPVHFVIGIGHSQRSASVPCHRLPGLLFKQSGIEADVVVDHPPEAV